MATIARRREGNGSTLRFPRSAAPAWRIRGDVCLPPDLAGIALHQELDLQPGHAGRAHYHREYAPHRGPRKEARGDTAAHRSGTASLPSRVDGSRVQRNRASIPASCPLSGLTVETPPGAPSWPSFG